MQTKPPKKGGETRKLWAGGSGRSQAIGKHGPLTQGLHGLFRAGPPGCGLPDITSRQQVTAPCSEPAGSSLGAEPVWAFVPRTPLISSPSRSLPDASCLFPGGLWGYS